MAGERGGHSLQATALVNEAYLRLIDARHVDWQNRTHFLAISARLMRRVLVDVARTKGYQKRGGGAVRVTFDDALVVTDQPGQDLVALDDALAALAGLRQWAPDSPDGPKGGDRHRRRSYVSVLFPERRLGRFFRCGGW